MRKDTQTEIETGRENEQRVEVKTGLWKKPRVNIDGRTIDR